MKKIPFFLVTGFLGSGKTTFLNKLILRFSSSYRIGIIQNEFAPGNVDGAELRRSGKTFDLLEVNKGSVFCVCLLSSFTHSLSDFIEEYKPDLIFLEASGLSDPISIGEMLQSNELKDKLYLSYIWSLIDAGSFFQIGKTLPRIKHQVRVADTVVINKTDLEPNNIEEITAWIKDLNPYCKIQKTTYCQIDMDDDLFQYVDEPIAIKRQDEHYSLKRSQSPNIGSYVIKTTKPIGYEQLKKFLKETAPGSYRIKGYVKLDSNKTVAVQSCFGDIKMEILTDYYCPTELIGMGPNIDLSSFGRKFTEYQNNN